MTLTPAAQKFVLHWGEMGQAWGINRTMAQVHALLFVAPTPLDAEEISTLLDVSRSNVSTSLRELITWGVVRRVHIIGDRRDRFEALKDVMETFRVIMAERKRREMDPTIALLEHCVHEAKLGDPAEQYTREQLEKMLEFTRMVTNWYSHIDNLSTSALLRLFRGGAMLAKVFGRGKHAKAKVIERPGESGGSRLALVSERGASRAGRERPRSLDERLQNGDCRARRLRLLASRGCGLRVALDGRGAAGLGSVGLRHRGGSSEPPATGRGLLGLRFRLGRRFGLALVPAPRHRP